MASITENNFSTTGAIDNLYDNSKNLYITRAIKEAIQNSSDPYHTRNLDNGRIMVDIDSENQSAVLRDNCGGMDKNTLENGFLIGADSPDKEGSGFRGEGTVTYLSLVKYQKNLDGMTKEEKEEKLRESEVLKVETRRDGKAYIGYWAVDEVNDTDIKMVEEVTTDDVDLESDGTKVTIPNIKDRFFKGENSFKNVEAIEEGVIKYFNEALLDPNFDIDIRVDGEELDLSPQDVYAECDKKVDITEKFDGPINIKSFKIYMLDGNKSDLFRGINSGTVRINNEFDMTIEYYSPRLNHTGRVLALVELEDKLEESIENNEKLRELEQTNHEGYGKYSVISELQRFIKKHVEIESNEHFGNSEEIQEIDGDSRFSKHFSENSVGGIIQGTTNSGGGEGRDWDELDYPHIRSIYLGRDLDFGDSVEFDVDLHNPTNQTIPVSFEWELVYKEDGKNEHIDSGTIVRDISPDTTISPTVKHEDLEEEKYDEGLYNFIFTLLPQKKYSSTSRNHFFRLNVDEGQRGNGKKTSKGFTLTRESYDLSKKPEKRRKVMVERSNNNKLNVVLNTSSPSFIRANNQGVLMSYKEQVSQSALQKKLFEDKMEGDVDESVLEKLDDIYSKFQESDNRYCMYRMPDGTMEDKTIGEI